MPKKLDDELMEYKRKIGKNEFKSLYAKLYQEAKCNKRFSGEHYINTEDKINAIKDKYKNGVTNKILSELYIKIGGENENFGIAKTN